MPPTTPLPLAAPPRALAQHTGYLLRLGYLRANQWAQAVLPKEMRARYFGALTVLTERGPQSQRDLCGALHVNPTVMVQVIDEMEARGLVHRQRDPDDRRCYALQLTAEGERVRTALEADMARGEAGLTEALTGPERDRLQDLLRRIVLAGEPEQRIAGALEQRTGYLLSAAHFRLRDRFAAGLRTAGIGPAHYGVLATLEAGGPSSQQAIATELNVTPTAVLQLVDQLEAQGLVRRGRNPADRRSYALELTPNGTAVLGQARAALAEVQAELAEMVGGESARQELHALLRKLLGCA